ncbi:hypothetical protein [Dactylosporangium sp. NPDC005555]|uniref:hypothetical protein n=1 Tax=Dactylosporangium sp. NPDC005555 TaxID=3154889 RepID=UPI0033AB533C
MDGDHLPYPARRRMFAARAVAGAADGTLGATLTALRGGDRQARETALFMALVGRDRQGVLAALTDDDPRIRLGALLAWAGAAETPAEPVARLVADAPSDTRARLYRRIRVCRRTDLAEALIDPVRARFGDAEAAALLPACGEATVARLLPQLTHALGDRAALTRRFPRNCLERAELELAELPAATRTAWWARHGTGVLAAAPALPHRVLDLLESYAPAGTLPGPLRAYGVLVVADPLRVLDLLTAPSRAAWLPGVTLPRAVLSRLSRLPVAGLAGLALRLRGNGPAFARLLAAVAPGDRAELFTRAMSDVDRSRSLPVAAVHGLLPDALRVAEARRACALEAVRQSEPLTLAYTAHLPWAEAEAPLLAATRRARAEDRVAAWQLLIRCAARSNDPAAVLAATHHLLRLRNEQDPVRAGALSSLGEVRPALLRPELVEPLEQVVADVVHARDSSPMALHQLSQLAVTVLRERFDSPVLVRWALHTFQRVLGDDRVPHLGGLDRRLRRGQETQAFEAVRGWVQLGAERARFEPLFAVTRALGRRAWRLPELQSMLERATRRGNLADVTRTAVGLWLADPRHRADRVEAVLREDPSAIALPVVWRAVCARRDDLLGAALTGPPPTGRFVPTGVRWVPPRAVLPGRWLPRQQQMYAERQADVVRDPGATPQSRATALRDAAPIPVHGEALLLRWADAGDVPVAEAALAALAWTDRPAAALPVLLAHAGDDRARVTVAALGRAGRFAPPSALLAALGPLLDPARGKVTVRKEAVRLLAARSVPGAADVLWRLWQDPALHRDVRVAVVSAARQRAEDPGMWRILRAASAGGGRDDVMTLLAADLWLVPVGRRAEYATLVAAAGAAPDRAVAVRAWDVLPVWAPWLGDVTGAVVARLTDLDDRVVWPAVVRAVVGLVAAGLGEAPLVAAVHSLAAAEAATNVAAAAAETAAGAAVAGGGVAGGAGIAGVGAADGGQDLAARRRVEALVRGVSGWSGRAAADAPGRRAVGAAGRALATVDGFVTAAAALLTEAADLADPAGLDEVRDLVADRPVLAAELAGRIRQRLEQVVAEPETLRRTAAALAARGGLVEGLFALAYTGRGRSLGWPVPWRAVVGELRRHQVAEVRDAALAVSLDQ